jgi:predicted component of type VI protein secretion system
LTSRITREAVASAASVAGGAAGIECGRARATSGTGSAQEISGLPFALVTQDGEKHAVPCAETLFTVRAMEAVTAKGLMPIVTMKGTDTVRLAIFQSIAEPYAALAGLWG